MADEDIHAAAESDEMVEVAAYRTEAEAREQAAELVALGIGPEVRSVEHVDEESGIAVTAYQLLVTPYDHRRAQELLGIVEAAPVPMGDDENPPVLEKAPIPWARVITIWIVALITIPLAAFMATYFLLSR